MTALASPPVAAPAHPVRSWTLGRSSAQLAALGAGLVALRATPAPGLPCPMLVATGIPCPGCGMTRAADALVHGQLGHALTTDPAAVAFLVGMAVVAIAYVVLRLRPTDGVPRWARGPALPIALGALLVAHWVTTLVTGGFVT